VTTKLSRIVAALAALVWLTAVALAEDKPMRGVALVVGQSAYANLPALPNPRNDAGAIADLLGRLGFEVTTVLDVDTRKLSRSLERFAEDAEGADVALLYYSGHGIEAGGENWLVPVDAEGGRAKGLAPISPLLETLQKTAPVTILLLDACRTNPFPPGTTVEQENGSEVPVASAGLAGTRGAAPMKRKDQERASQGAVIGFAAEPGAVALDGDPGGNSPYAAALLKHLGAGGFAFGDVMTMVTEEVYLKSSARQLPWTNASLRRTLYFGAPAEETGDDGQIRTERRGLLLTIARLSDVDRRQVVAAAGEQGVPMDALFAMLKSAGSNAPTSPDALDQLLQEQGARLKDMLAAGKPANISDPELLRLASLADDAVREGALNTAQDLYARAKTRMASIDPGLSQVEESTDALRRERAAVFAKSAETALLAFDYAQAAADFGSAHDEVERADPDLAWRYKVEQGKALSSLGYYGADNAALDQAIETLRDAADMVPLRKKPEEWLETTAGLGQALASRGDRATDTKLLEEAADTLAEALERAPPSTTPERRAAILAERAYALLLIGQREQGFAHLDEAASALNEAMAIHTRETAPVAWARLNHRLAAVLLERGNRETTPASLEAALAATDAALTVRTLDKAPLDWAATSSNRGIILAALGERDSTPARLSEAIEVYKAVLAVYYRDRQPLLWGETMANLGAAQFALSSRGGGAAAAAEAAQSFTGALDTMSRERAPLRWAALQDNLGIALRVQGDASGDSASFDKSITAFRLALEERTRERVPADWASTTRNLASTLWSLGSATQNPEPLRLGIEMIGETDAVATREAAPREWAKARNNQAGMLRDLGVMQDDSGILRKAVEQYRLALEVTKKEDAPLDWAQTTGNLGLALTEVGKRDKDQKALADAIAALEGARDAFAAAGITNYAPFFETSIAEAQIADMQITVDAKMKALATEDAAKSKP